MGGLLPPLLRCTAQLLARASFNALGAAAQRKSSVCPKNQYNTNFLKTTMDFSSDASAKLNLTISTGNIFSGNTTKFGGSAPQSKVRTSPCRGLQRGQKCLARPRENPQQ